MSNAEGEISGFEIVFHNQVLCMKILQIQAKAVLQDVDSNFTTSLCIDFEWGNLWYIHTIAPYSYQTGTWLTVLSIALGSFYAIS